MAVKFKKGTRRRALEYEKALVKHWKANKTFEKSVQQRPADNAYVFYDGPPFITGVPHHGTLLTSIVKDAVPRYQTMQGKRVERVWGWDCHGLPAEVFTEKKLGIKDKRDIGTKISLEQYILTCRENMVQTGDLWENTIDRIGRWVDFKGAYKTMDKEYMESVWWAFKKLYESGKIYEGEKVLLYCTRDATPISKAEVAMDNSYQDVTDPSVYVKFKLLDDDRAADRPVYLLAWTTMPWTLPANSGVAVHKDATYVEVEVAGEHFILAKDLLGKALQDEKHQVVPHTVIRELRGTELVGKSYEPLFDPVPQLQHPKAFKVWHADFVHLDEGTGVVHESPATGEEDYALAKTEGFPWIMTTDESGVFTMGEWKGRELWDANKEIAKTLHERGVVWRIDYIRHSYPHCHRCGTKLMYRAHPSWFMDIDGQRTEMLQQNSEINWFPEHIKHGRSSKTIQSAPDWNLSRDRFWATAMPVWKGTDTQGRTHDSAGKPYIKVVGSYAELKELSGAELEDYHRPWIDDVTFELDGVTYKRIEKVLDCWFESGSMPFAQFHYPFENVEKFEANFPGDFIVEYVPQVRAWFYYVQAISVGLFGTKAFKNALVHGTLAGNDGRKMSKSFGNYTDPNELMDQYSADSLRFLFMQSPLLAGEDFALLDKDVADIARKLAMVGNMYDFFTLYAEVDNWQWNGDLTDPSPDLTNPLDQWVVSRVHQLNAEVQKHMDVYDLPNATKPILPFIEDASNWFVRRSRRRFWKSGDDTDKQNAYRTLHYVLVQLAHIMAPITPFLAEEQFLQLTGGELGESVHLRDWPTVGHVNEIVLHEMATVRELITDGLSQRAAVGIKVRQPLAGATVVLPFDITDANRAELSSILTEELNLKSIDCTIGEESSIEIDAVLTDDLKAEGLAREIIRHIQSLRKTSGLNVEDRIELHVATDSKLAQKALAEFKSVIAEETLTSAWHEAPRTHKQTMVVDQASITISLEKSR